MFIDTHCHINMMVKTTFDVALEPKDIVLADPIIKSAAHANVKRIINVGTSLIESINCILLAQTYPSVYAAIGIHPNDCTAAWRSELEQFKKFIRVAENKVVAIGECGLDFHYPNYNVQLQKDAFKAQVELALEHNLGLIVHTRDAGDETLRSLEEFKGDIKRGIIHCFSEDQAFADTVLSWGFALGIGGTLTYPKNNVLRSIVINTPLSRMVLETDAPFLPPQSLRGKQNSPANIAIIAEYMAELKQVPVADVAQQTTQEAERIFALP